jgi:hypothetical protein
MRPISQLLGSVPLLCIGMFSAEAATLDRAGSLDWQTFQNMELSASRPMPHCMSASDAGAAG